MSSTSPSAERLASLDIFRGITIAGMILANNGGGKHMPWNGASPTDWIMPFFFVIVGVSMAFSFAARRARGVTDRALITHSLRRGLIIFGLGMFLNFFPFVGIDLETVRIPGVLNRIGFCYFFAALIVIKTGPRGQIIASAVILLGYWALMTLVPVPGYGPGVLSAAQQEGNLAAYLDRLLMGRHLMYGRHDWDANGFLSSWPALVNMLIGVRMGELLRSGEAPIQRARKLALAGVALATAGWIWGGCPGFASFLTLGEPRFGGPAFAINKLIWTSSFVLYTAGLGGVFLAACFWLVDIRRLQKWGYPFTVFGTNAILAYMIADLLAKILRLVGARTFIQHNVFAPMFGSQQRLGYAVAYTLAMLGLMTVAYRRRVFWKV
jgi:predicted acyltransferase